MVKGFKEAVAVVFAVNIEHNLVGIKFFAELMESVLKCSTAKVSREGGCWLKWTRCPR